MSKQDQTALLTVIEAVLDDYFDDLPLPLSADASKEVARTMAYLAKRKQALLSPAPKNPRKPKAAKSPFEQEYTELTKPRTASSEPIAHYEPSGEYVNPNRKRGRNG